MKFIFETNGFTVQCTLVRVFLTQGFHGLSFEETEAIGEMLLSYVQCLDLTNGKYLSYSDLHVGGEK
jgi:hypothetical protein